MNVLILGCAPCVQDDVNHVPVSDSGYIAIATGRMIVDWAHRLDYAASLHLSDIVHVEHATTVCTEGLGRGADIIYDQIPYRNGSSALYAVGFALLRGAERIVLAGCPIDDTGHYWDAKRPLQYDGFRGAWLRALPQIKGRVFSMSGWTRELLGAPS
jgi:hypothetical protein